MGKLIDGVWHREDRLSTQDGRFQRADSSFREKISADGSSAYPAEAGRYHLYASYACPWAHRTLIFRKLKKLEEAISVSVVEAQMGEQGWSFSNAYPDPLNGYDHLHQVYTRAKPDYTGRATVPVLWDKQSQTIVNNESAEIIRLLNREFDAYSQGRAELDFYPQRLRDEIDAINERIYHTVNNGVYRAGFARSQNAYEEAFDELFETLDFLEQRLGRQRYLLGEYLSEADWRLFTTLVRFDAVYHYHFKCNRRRLMDYACLWAYTRELYQIPGVADTVCMDHIKRHYYTSHDSINPNRLVPKGPVIDFNAAHGRSQYGYSL